MSNSQFTFGEKLKSLRKDSGKTQMEVVEEIEKLFGEGIRISQTTLSALEQREAAPRGEILEMLAEYYRVPINYFFESDSEKEKKTTQAKKYLDSLKDRLVPTREIKTHTNDNSASDTKVRKSVDNMRHWQPEYGEDEYLED